MGGSGVYYGGNGAEGAGLAVIGGFGGAYTGPAVGIGGAVAGGGAIRCGAEGGG